MNLKKLRTQRCLTQKDVADFLSCSTIVYCRYETGTREPSIDVLLKLSSYFGVTVDYLLGKEDISSNNLSAYEEMLIRAARSADERARQDALAMLESHCVHKKQL